MWWDRFIHLLASLSLAWVSYGASVDSLNVSMLQVCSPHVSHQVEVSWSATASSPCSTMVELVGPDGAIQVHQTTELSGSHLFEVLYPHGGAATVRVTVQDATGMASSARGVWLQPCAGVAPNCYPDLPDPQLVLTGTEDFRDQTGHQMRRYLLAVVNCSAYPDELFAPAPDLPPCGRNPNASRTWVDIYSEDGTRLYGFCALASSEDLGRLWFALPKDQPPPPCVFIVLHDRRCDISYRSNCVPIPGGVTERPALVIRGARTLSHPGGGDIVLERIGGLKEYEAAAVFIKGFEFFYLDGDHHINEIKLIFRDASLDTQRGVFEWLADLAFGDGGDGPFDDDFQVTYDYEVIALPRGSVTPISFGGRARGEEDLPWRPDQDPREAGFDGFRFDFLGTIEERARTDDPQDHHLNEIKIMPDQVIYADTNYDDEFLYEISFKAIKSDDVLVITGYAPHRVCRAPSCTYSDQIRVPDGYRFATVLLGGWRFDFKEEGAGTDHHLQRIGLRIENERFDPGTHTLRWDVRASYCDEKFDSEDDYFHFVYRYVVLAFRDAQVVEPQLPDPWWVRLQRSGSTLIANSGFSIFGNPDEDGDGLNDIWENLFMWTVNPYFVLDEEEMWYRREEESVANFVRVSPFPSKDQALFVILYFLNTWAKDYGYQYWVDEYTHSHNGDTEPIITVWRVITNRQVELRYVYFSRHGSEADLVEPGDIELLELQEPVPKFYVGESKHGLYPHCSGSNWSYGYWHGIKIYFSEDCGDGGTFRFPCYNVGEPGELLITGSLSTYGFNEDIGGLCPPGETCSDYCETKFCGGLGWEADCATSILCWLFGRWIPGDLVERLTR